MCFGSSPKAAPPPPPPADLAPAMPRIGEKAVTDNQRAQTKAKKKGTASLRIEQKVGGAGATGTNIPTK